VGFPFKFSCTRCPFGKETGVLASGTCLFLSFSSLYQERDLLDGMGMRCCRTPPLSLFCELDVLCLRTSHLLFLSSFPMAAEPEPSCPPPSIYLFFPPGALHKPPPHTPLPHRVSKRLNPGPRPISTVWQPSFPLPGFSPRSPGLSFLTLQPFHTPYCV